MSWVRTASPSAWGTGICAFLQHTLRAVKTVWAAAMKPVCFYGKYLGYVWKRSLSCLLPAITMKAAGITSLHGGSGHIYITIHRSKRLTFLSSWSKAKHLSMALHPCNINAKGVWCQTQPAAGRTCIPNSMYHGREDTCSRVRSWAQPLAVQISALPISLSCFYL